MSLNFLNPITINGATQDSSSLNFFTENTFYLNGDYSPQYQDVTVSGENYVNLVNAKANGLNYLKLYGGCEQRSLPEGYTSIASFTSEGTTTINLDTGIRYDANLKIECTVKDNSWGSYAGYFRLYTNETSKAFRLIYASTENGKGWFTSGGCTAGTSSAATDLVSGTKYHIILDKNGLTTNDTYSPRGGTVSGDIPNSTLMLCLSTSATRQLTWYDRCTVWVGTNIVFNGLTAKRNSDSAVGFYDTVSKEFFVAPNCTAGSLSPSPEFPQPIYCNNGEIKVSPNLFDVNTMSTTNKVSLADTYGNDKIFYSNQSSSIVMPCTENTDYIISLNGSLEGTIFRVATTERLLTNSDSYSNPYTVCAINRTPTNDTLTINSGSGAKYMYIQFGSTVIDNMLPILQVQLGTAATPYMPYKQIYADGVVETIKDSLNNTATAENLLAIGNYKDIQSVLDGAITRNIGVKVFNGEEDWLRATGANLRQFYIESTQGIIANNVSLFSNIAPYGCTVSNRTQYQYGCYSGSTGNLCFQMIGSTTLTDVTTFKAYLAKRFAMGEPVIVVYPLKTPTTETVTRQKLTTQKGANTIEITQASITPLALEAQYKAGIEVTITEVQNANLDNSVVVTIGE